MNDFIDINAKDNNGDSAFSLAFKNGCFEIAKMLKAHHNFVQDPSLNGTEILDSPKPEPNANGEFIIVFNMPQEELQDAIEDGNFIQCFFLKTLENLKKILIFVDDLGNLENIQPPAIIPVRELEVMKQPWPLHQAAKKGFIAFERRKNGKNIGVKFNNLN